MKDLKVYELNFSGLKIGIHQFDYHIDGGFFSRFEASEIQNANIDVKVEMEKQETMIILHFNLSGSVTTTCDRCLEPYTLEISTNAPLIIKYGDKFEEVSDKIIFIPPSMNALDISQYIYEYIILALPIQKTHSKIGGINGCNEKMISYLTNDNNKNNDEIDPRWKILSELNN